MSQLTLPGLLLAAVLVVSCGDADKAEQSAATSIAGPATFVGSDACQSCHQGEFTDWIGSHHQVAMQVADTDTVLGDFNDVSFDYFGETAHFQTRDDGYYVRTVDRDGQAVTFEAQGRHDPCVVPRAVPIVEAMVLLVLADHWLRQRAVDVL